MALSADEKEQIMQSRGGDTKEFSASGVKVYHPIIDGKPCIMTNTTGMSEAEAAEYCRDRFGKHRFGGFDK